MCFPDSPPSYAVDRLVSVLSMLRESTCSRSIKRQHFVNRQRRSQGCGCEERCIDFETCRFRKGRDVVRGRSARPLSAAKRRHRMLSS
jgi:hypothetical protein